MLSLNIHIKNQSSPEQPGISGSDSLFLSIVALSRELLFTKLLHTGCEIKVLTNVISERPEGFYNLPTAYAAVHKLFLVRVKQTKTKHVSFSMVKRLHRIFGNGSWLLFPMITRVHISLMISGRAGDEMCVSLCHPHSYLPTFLSLSYFDESAGNGIKEGTAFQQRIRKIGELRTGDYRETPCVSHIQLTQNRSCILTLKRLKP